MSCVDNGDEEGVRAPLTAPRPRGTTVGYLIVVNLFVQVRTTTGTCERKDPDDDFTVLIPV